MRLEDEVSAPTTSNSLCRFVPELWQTQLGGFCLQTLSFGRLMAIMGPILDMVVVSHVIKGASYEESGDT
jgi:hypothetical protein